MIGHIVGWIVVIFVVGPASAASCWWLLDKARGVHRDTGSSFTTDHDDPTSYWGM